MKKIDEIVYEINNRYKTRCPFDICNKMGINIITTELPECVKGLFVNMGENQSYILLKEGLSVAERLTTCAHELGHALLHSGINCMSQKSSLNISASSLEKEADYFCFSLLSEGRNDFQSSVQQT